MKRIIVAIGLALALAGCNTTTDSVTAAKSVYTLKASYGILLQAAIGYNGLPACAEPAVQPCRDPAVVAQLRQGAAAAGPAINSAENAVRTLGTNPTVVQAALAAATAAVDALKSTMAAYKIGAS